MLAYIFNNIWWILLDAVLVSGVVMLFNMLLTKGPKDEELARDKPGEDVPRLPGAEVPRNEAVPNLPGYTERSQRH